MQFSLYEEINKNEEAMNLVSEVFIQYDKILNNYLLYQPPSVTIERDNLSKTVEVLIKARKAINKDPE